MTARFEDGSQAGRFDVNPAEQDRTGVTTDRGVEYAHHLYAGTQAASAEAMQWQLRWTAPDCGRPVLLHVAANAADGDDSPLGDFIYTARTVVPPIDRTAGCSPAR